MSASNNSGELSAQQQTPPSNPNAEFFTVGHAAPADAETIAQIGANTFTLTFGWSVSESDLAAFIQESYTVDRVLKDLGDPAKETFAARDAATGQVLGFAQLIRGISDPCIPGEPATHAELCRVYIDTKAQGRGIGSRLCAAVEAQARAEGFEQLWLTVWENVPRTHRLYERLGFVEVGEAFFPVGAHNHRDLVYTKSI